MFFNDHHTEEKLCLSFGHHPKEPKRFLVLKDQKTISFLQSMYNTSALCARAMLGSVRILCA